MTLGGKYKDEYNNNPPPGVYDTDVGVSMTKPKSYEAFIKQGSGFQLIKEENPDAGQYDPHKEFGDIP